MTKRSSYVPFLRLLLAVILTIAALAYTLLVLTGKIVKDQQLSATHVVLLVFVSIVVILLVSPQSLNRLKLLELSGFKLELLERVREKQIEQDEALYAISLVIPLVLPKKERAHLVNLAKGETKNYKGGKVLRAELRRLRSVGLIKMTGKGYIEGLKSNMSFNLSDYVELTGLGRKWAKQVSRLEETNDNEDDDISYTDPQS